MANRWKVLGLLSVALVATGCTPHPSAGVHSYRFARVGSEYFVIPPDLPGHSPRLQRLPVKLGDLGAEQPDGLPREQACSIHQALFAFYPAAGKSATWVAEIPSPEAWEGEGNDDKIDAELELFFKRLDALQRGPCLPRGGALQARSAIVENLAVPAPKTLWYKYSYRLGNGFLDLEPGMRLRIERVEYRPSPTQAQTVANYWGTRTAYYEVGRNKSNQTLLKLIHNDVTPGLPPTPDLPDHSLVGRVNGLPLSRLFFSTKFVPPNRQRASIIIGAESANRLEEATRTIQNNPEFECSRLAPQIVCVAFYGPVIVSAELKVAVNGRRTYFPVGSTLGRVLERMHPEQRVAALRSLRIQRLFRAKYANLEFDRRDPAILRLVLLGGDKISWSTRSTSSHGGKSAPEA